MVAGRITRSTLEEKRVDTSYGDGLRRSEVGYQPQIEYQYRVGDETLTGKRLSLVEKQYTQKAGQKVLEKYPIGVTVQVHYDPENPQEYRPKLVTVEGTSHSSLQNAILYIHSNPVVAGLVSEPRLWPFGSARRGHADGGLWERGESR